MADKRFTFKKLNFNHLNKYSWYEAQKDKKFVKYGDDNKFPFQLIDLYNKSSIHGACVNSIVEGIIGGGLTANEEAYLQRANSHGDTWNDIFEKVSLDMKLYGSFALEIIYSKDRTRTEAYHIDFSKLRAAKKDHRGHIPGYYISDEWDKKFHLKADDEDIIYLPVYNPEKSLEEPSQIYVSRNYRPGQDYYPLPDYVGALRVIELDTEIDNFHTNNIKNGLAPSLSITTFTNGSDDQLRSIEEQLNANYGGSDNAGSLMYIDVASKEEAPVITPIPQNGADGYYTTINDLVVQKILTAHRITSPMILGIKTEGQLGGRAEVIDAYLLFQNTVLVPYQQDILGCLEYIMSYNYPDIVLGVETKQLYNDGEVEEEVIVETDTTDAEERQVDDEQPELLA